MDFYFIGIAIFFFAAALQGLSGFGFSILALPLLTLFLSPRLIVPILLLYSMIINLVVLRSSYKELRWKENLMLFFCGILAMPIGVHILVNLNENILKAFIGAVIIGFSIFSFKGYQIKLKNDNLAMAISGIFSGILGGSISMSGPPIIIFLKNKKVGKHSFRGNLAIYFFILNIFSIPVFYWNGLLTAEVFELSLRFLPGLLIGVVLGNFLSHKIKESSFHDLTLILLFIIGLIAFLSGLKFQFSVNV